MSESESDKKPQKQEEDDEPQGYSIPLIRLRINDVCSEGAEVLLGSKLNLRDVLMDAVAGVLSALYTPKTAPKTVRSVTLIVRGMDGVAYTTGMDIDDDHKEIHLSADYLRDVHERSKGKQDRQEILGVIRHEMVHCFQYNSKGTANGGLIEGIADWVRYKAGFIPPHWHSGGGNEWDDGYDKTAYFLLYLEEQYGPETVPRINGWMKDRHYSDKLFKDLFNETPKKLFEKYKKWCQENKDKPQKKPQNKDCEDSKESSPEEEGEESPSSPNDGDDHSYVEVGEAHSSEDGKEASEMTLVCRDRLCKLSYDGTGSLKRFLNSFEGLIEVLDPKMSEKERKLLLVTALKGEAVSWLDNIDPEDELSYSEIKAIFEANSSVSFKSEKSDKVDN